MGLREQWGLNKSQQSNQVKPKFTITPPGQGKPPRRGGPRKPKKEPPTGNKRWKIDRLPNGALFACQFIADSDDPINKGLWKGTLTIPPQRLPQGVDMEFYTDEITGSALFWVQRRLDARFREHRAKLLEQLKQS